MWKNIHQVKCQETSLHISRQTSLSLLTFFDKASVCVFLHMYMYTHTHTHSCCLSFRTQSFQHWFKLSVTNRLLVLNLWTTHFPGMTFCPISSVRKEKKSVCLFWINSPRGGFQPLNVVEENRIGRKQK